MREPSVTIVVSTLKNHSTILKCVESLLSQTYYNCRIYITSADDKTTQLLEPFRDKIRLEQVNLSLPAAYNHMLESIDTEYIAFTDGDCVLDEHWLQHLMSGFETGVSATGGWVGTPPDVNKLQSMIGRDLENKYNHLSRYTRKLPTMSLCVPTAIVKQLKFDESLPVGQDTDFCYRLPGKIRYVAEAKLWHHHRATWWSYFNQQYKNAKYAVILFNKNRHMATKGDGITNKVMMVQPFLMLLSMIPIVGYFTFFALMMIWSWEARKITKVRNEFMYAWLLLYPTRAMAYLLGLIMGTVKVITKK